MDRGAGNVLPVQNNLPLLEGDNARNRLEQGALAAAGRAEQGKKLPLLHREGEVGENRFVLQRDRQAAKLQQH